MHFASRRNFLILSGFAAAAGLSSCSSIFDLKPSKIPAQDETEAALPLVNALRAKNDLPPLRFDAAAARAAADQAVRMAAHGKMEHNIGFGADFAKRMKGMDVTLPAAENIATGQDSVDRAVDAWINSHKHLVNMLGNYKGLGVAVAQNSASGNRPYWAMVLSN
ncbi:CAP domain-containing protein [Rhizobium sp. L1K21]|uniref:CAP domain-containing protein n=1 Tax=Rhizobium sp. L1K21 TaxID=2954933 RepID=UPI0020926CA1|nr:CAP domain-containing protein [Rhizobium sp. L1K21]MCO6187176.1 CAP domain-containing protein [Rhizobium sp. L1K21]